VSPKTAQKKNPYAYTTAAITTAEVIEELISLAKELDAASQTAGGRPRPLPTTKVAFTTPLAPNDSAVEPWVDAKLKTDRRPTHRQVCEKERCRSRTLREMCPDQDPGEV